MSLEYVYVLLIAQDRHVFLFSAHFVVFHLFLCQILAENHPYLVVLQCSFSRLDF